MAQPRDATANSRKVALDNLQQEIAELHSRAKQPRRAVNHDQMLKARIESKTNEIIAKLLQEEESKSKKETKRNTKEQRNIIAKSIPQAVDPVVQASEITKAADYPPEIFLRAGLIRPPFPLATKRSVIESKPPPSFTLRPSTIKFKDFVPGTPQTQTVSFTNISNSMAQFKVKTMNVNLEQFVTIVHSPSVKVGLGSTLDILLKFMPAADTETMRGLQVEFLSSMGDLLTLTVDILEPCQDPVIGSVGATHMDLVVFDNSRGIYPNLDRLFGISKHKKASLATLVGSVLDLQFGHVVLGASRSVYIELVNNGFNPVDFRIDIQAEPAGPFKIAVNSGVLSGYSQSRVDIFLCPAYSANWKPSTSKVDGFAGTRVSQSLTITFDNGKTYTVNCSGVALDPPLFSSKSVLDFQNCTVDTLYHDIVQVSNSHNSALRFYLDFSPLKVEHAESRFWVDIPHLGQLTLSTSFGFVQPLKDMPVWFTLKLNKDALDANPDFRIPFSISYIEKSTGKTRQVPVTIIGRVCDDRVFISAQNLDFGRVSMLEKKHVAITVENKYTFKQIVHITTSDPAFSLLDTSEYTGNYMVIEPLQIVQRTGIFQPLKSGQMEIDVGCHTTRNQTCELKLKGTGVLPPLTLSSSQIKFDPLAFGSVQSLDICLKRTIESYSKEQIWNYEFGDAVCTRAQGADGKSVGVDNGLENMPDIVSIWPPNGSVDAGKSSQHLQVCISAPAFPNVPAAQVIASGETTSTRERKNTGPLDSATTKITVNNLASLFKMKLPVQVDWIIPCKITTCTSARTPTDCKPEFNDQQVCEFTVYLLVSCQFVQPKFTISSPADFSIPFGNVVTGGSALQKIHIRNNTDNELYLKLSGIDPTSYFYLARAIRPISARETGVLHVGFKPKIEGQYFARLRISEGATISAVKMIATSSLPRVKLTTGHLDFGNLLVGEESTLLMTLTNDGSIAVQAALQLHQVLNVNDSGESMAGMQNFNGRNAFYIEKSRLNLPVGGSLTVNVRFKPDRPSDLYYDQINVSFTGQTSPITINVCGRAWGSSGVPCGYLIHPRTHQVTSWIRAPQIELADSVAKLYPDVVTDLAKLDDDAISAVYLSTRRKLVSFVTYKLDWKQFAASELGYKSLNTYWRVMPCEFSLSNLKPAMKIDSKKSTAIEYTFEECPDSFEYDEFLQDYLLKPGARFHNSRISLDSIKGIIELGQSKDITATLKSPQFEFASQCRTKWDSLPKPVKNDGTRPMQQIADLFDKDGSLKQPIVPKDEMQKISNPQDFFAVIPSGETEFYTEKMERLELERPKAIETVYKLTIKGGYRAIEPRGIIGPSESTLFYVKFKAEADQ